MALPRATTKKPPPPRRHPAPAPRGRKPRGLGHERHGEILAAAKALFVSEGYETVTTRKLAEQVGLSQTGLYVYFKSKEEILEALCTATFKELSRRFCQTVGDSPPDLGLLRRLIGGYMAFALENPDEYQLTFMVSHAMLKSPQHKDLSQPFSEQAPGLQAFTLFREQVARMVQAGAMRRMDVTVATQTIWAACHGLVALLIARPEFPWADRKQLLDTMVETLVRGLENPRR
ncbi:TetR/AcrR family transcriptional regulator [Vineibacter terrae]|nr:TetR/AcrR family transcriptional regulator [Vineibacter terrae]